jgi:hypothetical protein
VASVCPSSSSSIFLDLALFGSLAATEDDMGSPQELQNLGLAEEYSIFAPQLVQNIDLIIYNNVIL